MEDDGYGTPDEDRTAHLSPPAMTINAIKDWLTEHGHENVVWELTSARAKKPRQVAAHLNYCFLNPVRQPRRCMHCICTCTNCMSPSVHHSCSGLTNELGLATRLLCANGCFSPGIPQNKGHKPAAAQEAVSAGCNCCPLSIIAYKHLAETRLQLSRYVEEMNKVLGRT